MGPTEVKERNNFILQRAQQSSAPGKENAGAFNSNSTGFIAYSQQMKNGGMHGNDDEKKEAQVKGYGGVAKTPETSSPFYSKILGQGGVGKTNVGPGSVNMKFVQSSMNAVSPSQYLGKK